MTVKPIFVSGIGRSGTSALLASLTKHKSMHTIPKAGEAPFVSSFLNFLVEFENKSPGAEYNKKNYRLDDDARRASMADFLMLNQCGEKFSNDNEEKYWIAKTSLFEETFDKAVELFGEVRCVYIMRNGIEVINSARKFDGFKSLGFDEHCRRWLDNIEHCRYLHDRDFCSVIKHDSLVKFPEETYKQVFADIELPYDDAPAKWISSNLFNSSFDETKKNASTSSVFDNRLIDAWSEWSDEEKATFIEKCDSVMREFGFVRPYDESSLASSNMELLPVVPLEVASSPESIANTVSKEHGKSKTESQYSNFVLDACEKKIHPSELNYIANISKKHNYLFVNNPKVASTSLLKKLQIIEDSQRASEMETPHQRNRSPLSVLDRMPHSEQEHWFESEDVFRFAFTRCPFSRLLSAYLSKVAKPLRGYKFDSAKKFNIPPKGQIIELVTGKAVDESTDFTMEIGFAEFVEAVCSLDPFLMDLHWKPQFNILMPDKIAYSYIGEFDNLNSEFAHICECVGIKDDSALEYSKNRTGSQEKLARYFTKDIEKMVLEKYKIDFEQFGYVGSVKTTDKRAA